jgi:hypothetical protein
MASSNSKVGVHLTFNLDDPDQAAAYNYFLDKTKPRQITAFFTECILLKANHEKLADMIAQRILSAAGPINSSGGTRTEKAPTGKKRGRPKGSVKKPTITVIQPTIQYPATKTANSTSSPQPERVVEVDGDMLDSLQVFGI